MIKITPLVLGLTLAGSLSATAADISEMTVAAVTQPVPTNPQYLDVDVPILKDKLSELSGGKITLQLSSHAERNLGGAEIVRLVRSGQVEIGAGTLSTLSGDVPILDGVDLSGMNPDIDKAHEIADKMMPIANEKLERFGTKLVVMYPFPAQVLFCRDEFKTLEDLKGRKVRTFGNSLVDLMSGIGAQPVSIGFPEVYSSLELGVVDCAVTGTGSGAAANWPEVSSYISNLPLSWAVAGYMVNLDWWNGLSADEQAVFQEVFDEMNDTLWDLGLAATQDGIDCNIGNADACKINKLTDSPMTEVKATDADRALVSKVMEESVLPNFVERCGPECGEIYSEVIAPISGVELAK
ncbi:TRAP transporter substrate-binding protein [Pseudooceanicola sp. 502str34]